MHFLEKIIKTKKQEVEQRKTSKPLRQIQEELKTKGENSFLSPRGFKKSISAPGKIHLIAEIKKASLSRGIIREDFDPLAIARTYEENRASALSVLTEEHHFLGKLSYLESIKKEVNLPVLRKDFIIDEYQVYESRLAGADAVLLIVRILPPENLKQFLQIAGRLGIDCLVEVHNRDELETARDAGAEIIGINNRDLDTFKVDLKITEKLAKLIGGEIIKVSESGISSQRDLGYLADLGVNAVLIGEAFMASPDIAFRMKEIMGTD